MDPQSSRMEFIREVLDAVVRQEFPDEVSALEIVLAIWADTPGPMVARDRAPSGVAASGTNEEPGYHLLLVLTMDILVPENFDTAWNPTQAEVDDAAAQAAASLMLPSIRCERARIALAPELRAALEHRRKGQSGGARSGGVWVEVWRAGHLDPPYPSDAESVKTLTSTADVDLVIDEHHCVFIAEGKEFPFRDFTPIAKLGIRFVLENSGGVLEDSMMAEATGRDKKALLKKYPSGARIALRMMLQREMISRGRDKEYEVARNWSWMWIRVAADRAQSRLR